MSKFAFSFGASHFLASGVSPTRLRAARAASPGRLRGALILGCLAAVLLAAAVGQPAPVVRADPQLAFLLRGMALIKGAMVLAAVAVVAWRLGKPTTLTTAAASILGTAVLAGASMLIWQLSFIPLAALAFHVAAFVVLFTAWRDGAGEQHSPGAWADVVSANLRRPHSNA